MKHLLVANIYFAPRSFGGATIVAEEVTRRLALTGDWKITILSGGHSGERTEPIMMRTRLAEGLDHYTINTGGERTPATEFENPEVNAEIRALLARLQPDVAHVHCIQGLGVGLLEALAEAGTPTVLTTHDYWWICEKIFMLNALGKYCGQEVIDQKVCASCVHTETDGRARWVRAQEVLRLPSAITYPSRHARAQYERNGAPSDRGVVLSNGVTHPGPDAQALRRAKASDRLRFGYIGGPGPLKGWAMIERAFKALDPAKAELVLVDAATHLSGSWWETYDFGPLKDFVTVVPGYSQDTLDEFFAGIDVLLFLSTWKETFGLTAREAALRGVHVLATDCGAPTEHLIDGDSATILPGLGTAADLRKALKRLVDDGLPTPSDAARAKIAAEVRTYDQQAADVDALLRAALAD
ncbi:MAG: glycosyltransferase family 4 protein [Pseudomonadota bacterium]